MPNRYQPITSTRFEVGTLSDEWLFVELRDAARRIEYLHLLLATEKDAGRTCHFLRIELAHATEVKAACEAEQAARLARKGVA